MALSLEDKAQIKGMIQEAIGDERRRIARNLRDTMNSYQDSLRIILRAVLYAIQE